MERKERVANYKLNTVWLLQVAFIVLRLCNVIDWRWKWVLAPTWITAALALLMIFVTAIIKAAKDG